MPTTDAVNHVRVFGAAGSFGNIGGGSYAANKSSRGEKGLYSVLKSGKLTAEAKDIIELIVEHDAVLATGHMSKEEIYALVEYGRGKKLSKIIITHPEMQCPNLDIATQVELAGEGCLMEYCAINCMPMFQSVTSEQMKEAMDAVGADHAIIATDSGQPFSPKTPDMFRVFAQVLHEKGVAIDDISKMAIHNPARLLGVTPRNTEIKFMKEVSGVAQDA